MNRCECRTARAALVAVACALVLATGAAAQSPYPERQGIIANGTDMVLSATRINGEFEERIGSPYALDGLALLVDNCRPDPEVYLDDALVHYGMAPGGGAIYDDAVVWFVCLDPRFVGFFSGSAAPFADRLDENAVADAMTPQLQAGNFTGAVTSGLDVVAAALAAAEPAGGAQTVPQAGQPAGGAESSSAAETASSADGQSATGAALLVGAAALGGLWWWSRRRARPAAPAALPETASAQEVAQAKLTQLEQRLVPNSPALARLVLAYESVGDEAVLELNRRHLAMVERLAELKRQVEALTGGVVPAPLADDGPAQAERYRARFEEADALLAYVDELDAEAEHAEMLNDRAPILAVEARHAVATGQEAYGRDGVGFDLPSADAAFALPTALVSQAEDTLTSGDRITAGRLAEDASDIAVRIARVAAEMRQTRGVVDEAAALFDRVDDYAPASWADIQGNGSEAEESLAAARELFGRIVGADHGAFGQDQASGFVASLERVFDELARARELVVAIRERLENLRQAQRDAAASLESVWADVAAAREWIAQPAVDPDVDTKPVADLDQAAAMLAEAQAAMADPAPDWLAIRRQIQAADRAADAALAEARAQADRMAAQRRQLASARSAAEAAVDRAERFLSAHRGDIEAAAAARLEDARAALGAARAAERAAADLADAALAAGIGAAIDAFERAGDLASGAYDAMAADFERLERQREAYVPRPSWIGPTVPIPMGPRRSPFPGSFGGWGGGAINRPGRPSRWGGGGGLPGGGSLPGRSSGGMPGGAGRPASSRRGGGRGW